MRVLVQYLGKGISLQEGHLQGRGEGGVQGGGGRERSNCLVSWGKQINFSKGSNYFRFTTWGHSSFLGPKLTKGSQLEVGGK